MKVTALLLAGYFLLGSLLPRTDFSQLWHLDDLRRHFQQHVAEAEAAGEVLSYRKFFYEHFINPDQHEQDHPAEHDALPLHSISSSVTFLCNNAGILDGHLPVNQLRTPVNYCNVFHLQGFCLTIPHPPSV